MRRIPVLLAALVQVSCLLGDWGEVAHEEWRLSNGLWLYWWHDEDQAATMISSF